ncbi:hypothetical protein [Streptomyces sp. RPT161]|uniref:hypothetical protein n=1 Tax=Streptomyces sp. RPT161 TaxID=3015993 RepID=UPI0022B8EA42|nr:hypothetical protein [Streptomyces sp. RPT161]
MQDPLPSVTAAIEAVDEELQAHKAGHGHVSNPPQLTKFRQTLESMKHQIESNAVPPRAQRLTGMGRVIADSWPFDSELAALILEAERRYLRM